MGIFGGDLKFTFNKFIFASNFLKTRFVGPKASFLAAETQPNLLGTTLKRFCCLLYSRALCLRTTPHLLYSSALSLYRCALYHLCSRLARRAGSASHASAYYQLTHFIWSSVVGYLSLQFARVQHTYCVCSFFAIVDFFPRIEEGRERSGTGEVSQITKRACPTGLHTLNFCREERA